MPTTNLLYSSLWDALFAYPHEHDQAKPAPAEGGVQSGETSTSQHFFIGNLLLPPNSESTTEAMFVKCVNFLLLWDLRRNNTKYKVSWKILKNTNSKFRPLKMCTLCNLERLHIAAADKRKILNKRNELVTQCPHYPKEFF